MARSNSIDVSFSLDRVRSDSSPNLWVFNKTPELKGQLKNSIVHMVISLGNGDQKTIVRIMPTWVPVNIGMQAPKRAIFDSPDFLRAINLGLIEPITNDEAKKFYEENDEARTEYDEVSQKLNATAPMRTDVQAPIKNTDIDLAEGQIETTTLNPRIIYGVGRFNENDMTTNEFISLLRTEGSSLGDEEFKYVLANTTDPKVHTAVNRMMKAA